MVEKMESIKAEIDAQYERWRDGLDPSEAERIREQERRAKAASITLNQRIEKEREEAARRNHAEAARQEQARQAQYEKGRDKIGTSTASGSYAYSTASGSAYPAMQEAALERERRKLTRLEVERASASQSGSTNVSAHSSVNPQSVPV